MALTKIDDRGLKTPIDLLDNEKIRVGTGNDLEIYHDGSHSIVSDSGTGQLRLTGSNVVLRTAAYGEVYIVCTENGSVDLYHDNTKRFETTSTGVKFTGNLTADDDDEVRVGTGGDLQLLHNGTDSYITNTTGVLYIRGGTNGIQLRPKNDEWALVAAANGAVEIAYDGNKKFETTSTGVNLTDQLTVQGNINAVQHMYFPDNKVAYFGGGNDLQIYHDGSSNVLETAVNTKIGKSGEASAWFNPDGAVQLFYDNTKKFETTSYGVGFTQNVRLNTDSNSLQIGASQDLKLYHDGTDSRIKNETGQLILQSDDLLLRNQDSDETYVRCQDNGGVELYYDNTLTCYTSNGCLSFPDSQKIFMGGGNDLQLYHDGTDSRIDNNTGDLHIETTGSGDDVLINSADDIYLRPQGSESGIEVIGDGAVKLFYDSALKFATTTAGVYSNGGVGIGSSAAANTINVSAASGSSQTTLYYGFGTIDLTSASDERVKDNIKPTSKGLDEILKLPVVDFTYKPTYSDDSTTVRTGGIAQEWQKVDPNLIQDDNEDLLFINYKEAIPLLIKAVQELSAKVAALEAG